MIRITVAATAVVGGLILTGTAARSCSECLVTPQTKEQRTPQPKVESVTHHRRARRAHRPVATATGRVVKTHRGQYADVASPRRPKRHRQAPTVQYLPVVVSPEAAQTMAMFPSPAMLQEPNVRIVPAEEVNEIDLAAAQAPIKPVLVRTHAEIPMPTVSAKAEIERRSVFPKPKPEPDQCSGPSSLSLQGTWIERARKVLSLAYEVVAGPSTP